MRQIQKNPVLIVENEPNLSNILADCLRQAGYTVAQAFNPQEGFRILENFKCALIVVDLTLPLINTEQFLANLPAVAGAVPVVALTNNVKLLEFNLSVKATFAKPLDLEKVLSKIAELTSLQD